MIDNEPEPTVRLELSEDEQAVLQFCRLSLPETLSKIESSSDGIVTLSECEAEILSEDILDAIKDTRDDKVRSVLNNLSDRMPLSPVLVNIVEKFATSGFKSVDEFHEVWNYINEEDNDTPDSQRGNLTPNQFLLLQCATWGDDESPVHFNTELSLNDVNISIFFRNTRLFLKKLLECHTETTATAKGNLNRKFARLMIEVMELDEYYKELITTGNTINEEDVRPLHIIRVICGMAGLIEKRSKKFLVPEKYHNLLADEKAGELYYLLFGTYFRTFNLGFCDRLPILESMQGTFDYTLYRLSKVCNNYQTMDKLFDKIFLPKVKNDIREICSAMREKGSVVEARIIRHLVKFGLLECVMKKGEYIDEIEKIRKSPLFDKFIVYNL